MDIIDDNRELGWDDEIEKESDFVLLPEGDYDFTVTAFERARHGGSEKLPPCNKAIVHIRIDSPEGSTTIKHQLFLHTITEGMLSAFFIAIGQKRHGEKVKMNWNAVVGATGRCKVCVDTYTKDNGEKGQSNKIKKFYDPEDAPKTPARTWQPPENKSFTPGAF